VPCKPRHVGGVKGHNMKETSFPGSPFDILRAMSFAERPRLVGGELHLSASIFLPICLSTTFEFGESILYDWASKC